MRASRFSSASSMPLASNKKTTCKAAEAHRIYLITTSLIMYILFCDATTLRRRCPPFLITNP